MSKNFSLLIGISVLFLSSCKNSTTKKIFHLFQSDTTVHIKASLPAIGEKYYYTITNETQTTIEYNDKKTESGNNIQVGLVYESTADSTGEHLLKITYDELHLLLKKPEGEQEYDANAASYDPVEKLLGIIKGSSLYVSLSKNGDVVNIKGSKEIADKVIASMQAFDSQVQKTLQEQVTQLVGEAFIKNNLEQGFKLFPDSAIKIGASWTRKEINSNGINYTASTKYTLESLEDQIAEVEVESEIGTGEGVANNIMGLSVMTNLKGDQTGSITMNTATGIILSNVSAVSMNGTIQVMGKEVPITIKMKKEVKSKKI